MDTTHLHMEAAGVEAASRGSNTPASTRVVYLFAIRIVLFQHLERQGIANSELLQRTMASFSSKLTKLSLSKFK